MTKINNPKVKMVIGRVKISKIGFTVNRSNARTIATKNAGPKPDTEIPGSNRARIITATAVNNSFTMTLIKILNYTSQFLSRDY